MTRGNTTRPSWFYKLVLLSATLVWGGNFVISKGAVSELHATWVIAIRFFVAGVLLGIVFFPRIRKNMSKRLLKAGIFMGFFTFLGYWTQLLGLSGTTPSKNAFLSACYCVFVPFIWWIIARKKPTRRNLLAAAVCVAGMALITLQGDLSVSWGDGVSILSAVTYAVEIAVISLLIKDHDVITVTSVQLVSGGAFSGLLGILTNTPIDFQLFTHADFLARMAYIIILASCYASTAQNSSQVHVPPAQVSLMFALESVFGTIFSVIFFHEALTAQMLVGFALVFVAILVSEMKVSTRAEKKA